MAVRSLSRFWENGQLHDTTNVAIKQEIPLSRDMLASVLQDCNTIKDLDGGRCVQSIMVESGYDWSGKIGWHLVNLYVSCHCLIDAVRFLNSLSQQTTSTWTTVISAHTEQGDAKHALILYRQMQLSGVKPNLGTYVSAFKSCASTEALAEGRLIHIDMMKQGQEVDLCTGNTLIDMYCKCNSMQDAHKTFDDLQTQNVVSWNSMLTGYIRLGHYEEAMEILEKMHQQGMEPSNVTLLCELQLFAAKKALQQGKCIHTLILKRGIESDIFLGNALLNLYVKCNKLNDAHDVFDRLHVSNVVTWSVMIQGYADNGNGEEALKMFMKMRLKGVRPDEVTFVCVLKACSTKRALEEGKLVHSDALKCIHTSSIYLESVLVGMYTKCGSLSDARRVFNNMASRNVVSWSCMLEGYAEQGQGEEALELFKGMYKEGIEPNGVTYMSSIKACIAIGAVCQGMLIHGDITEQGLESDLLIGNSLIDMYTKGGDLVDAVRVFDMLPERTLESWSALIAGCANHGSLDKARHYFEGMCTEHIEPDIITFLSLLYACSHAGLLNEGHFYFKIMTEKWAITPTKEHYACWVDMFGRAGLLDEAEVVLCKMPLLPDPIMWKALLSPCIRHNNLAVGTQVFEYLLNSDCRGAAAYVLMSNIYVATIIGEDV